MALRKGPAFSVRGRAPVNERRAPSNEIGVTTRRLPGRPLSGSPSVVRYRRLWAGGGKNAPLAGLGDHMQWGSQTRNRAW